MHRMNTAWQNPLAIQKCHYTQKQSGLLSVWQIICLIKCPRPPPQGKQEFIFKVNSFFIQMTAKGRQYGYFRRNLPIQVKHFVSISCCCHSCLTGIHTDTFQCTLPTWLPSGWFRWRSVAILLVSSLPLFLPFSFTFSFLLSFFFSFSFLLSFPLLLTFPLLLLLLLSFPLLLTLSFSVLVTLPSVLLTLSVTVSMTVTRPASFPETYSS